MAALSVEPVKLCVVERERNHRYDLVNERDEVLLRIEREGRISVASTLRYTLPGGLEIATTHGASPFTKFTFLDIPLKSFAQSLTSGSRKRWWHARCIFVYDSTGASPAVQIASDVRRVQAEARLASAREGVEAASKLRVWLIGQLYVRKHKDEPLAYFTLSRRDTTKITVEIEARALVPGPHVLLLDGTVTRLLVWSIIHARQAIILRRS